MDEPAQVGEPARVAQPARVDGIVEWELDRLADLVSLCDLAFSDETLGTDDLEFVCFGDAGVSDDDLPGVRPARTATLATEDGTAVAVVTSRRIDLGAAGAVEVAHLQLVAVHPARRRRGLGRAVVAAAERWAADRGAVSMQVGGAAPFYLFSGVDTRWTEALCLFESMGYDRTQVVLDMVCPTLQSTRRPGPPGVVVEHVQTDAQVAAVADFARASYPHWVAELARAGECGTAVLARDALDESVIGAAAHSVGRLGVIGPVAVLPGVGHRGVGTALMGAVLSDLSVAGLRTAEIAWTSTVSFYAKACGARVGRASQMHRRDLPPSVQG